jgi:hypothetical protein
MFVKPDLISAALEITVVTITSGQKPPHYYHVSSKKPLGSTDLCNRAFAMYGAISATLM